MGREVSMNYKVIGAFVAMRRDQAQRRSRVSKHATVGFADSAMKAATVLYVPEQQPLGSLL